jgi:cation diffusion facilitator family transporter
VIRLLARIFIKDSDNITSPDVRREWGVLCGCVGIGFNVLLFAGKFLAGVISGSIAITADAFNNLSDAGSSTITLLGFKLAGSKPDVDHPFGHGRFEYLSALIVSIFIVLMGFELAKTSFGKIIHPEPIESSPLIIVILIASICVKLYMNYYNRTVGKKINSTAMAATAIDSLSDSVATTAVLIATLVGQFTSLRIDGWCGILVALFILYSGFVAAKKTIDPLLGQPPEPEFVDSVDKIVKSHSLVKGIHDMVVHDYGPGRIMVSLHAEVPCDVDIMKIHDEIDNIEVELHQKLGCDAVIHMDPIETNNSLVGELRTRVSQMIKENIDPVITIHDFRMVPGPTHTNLIFDVVVPFKFALSDEDVEKKIKQLVRRMDGNYFAVITVDKSYVL